MKIDMWQRIKFEFPEIFLPGILKHTGVPSEETTYNVVSAGDGDLKLN